MALQFTKAEKKRRKLRMAMFGPSGSGKTMSALRISTGMQTVCGGKVGLIDSEFRSSELYADRYPFEHLDLGDNKALDTYVDAINVAKTSGISVLVIDSLTHSWHELLEEVELLAKQKYRGNTWSAWSEGTPKQKKLINAILGFPGHVIATMRSKTAWEQEERNGKKVPVRIGLSPEGGKGIEYEFDFLCEFSPDHVANVIKDRTGKWQDKFIDKPDEIFGRELVEWLNTGVEDIGLSEIDFAKHLAAVATKATVIDCLKGAEKVSLNATYSPDQKHRLAGSLIMRAGDLGSTIDELNAASEMAKKLIKDPADLLAYIETKNNGLAG